MNVSRDRQVVHALADVRVPNRNVRTRASERRSRRRRPTDDEQPDDDDQEHDADSATTGPTRGTDSHAAEYIGTPPTILTPGGRDDPRAGSTTRMPTATPRHR